MNNIKILIISLITISIILFIGIKTSNALYNKDKKTESKLLLTYFDNDSIDINNFNNTNVYDYTFALSNLSNNYLKYSLVWANVVNNIDTIEDINNVTYSLSTCDESYNTCKIIEENTILPATTNNTLAAIPNVINQYIEGDKIIYYKLTIKSNNNINKSFKGNIKLMILN